MSLTNYLQDIALYTNSDYSKDSNKVKLMTIHQAKGLEFPYVFVVGLSEGIFPNMRSIRERKKNGEEEERRLMYVAVTRAEKILFLTESEGYNAATGLSKYPSRFLTEIKKNLFITEGEIDSTIWEGTKLTATYIDKVSNEEDDRSEIFQEGEIVNHEKLGKGIIISYDKNRDSYLVSFEDKGNRNIMSGFLKKETDISITTLTGTSNDVKLSTRRQIHQRYPSVSNSHQPIIKFNVGDYVRHRVNGYGRVTEIKENSWIVHFFNSNEDIEIEKSQVLMFIISSEIDSFYKSNKRQDDYFYVKRIEERNDTAYFCGVNSSLGIYIDNSLFSINMEKMIKCTEEEFKEHCTDWEVFTNYRVSED